MLAAKREASNFSSTRLRPACFSGSAPVDADKAARPILRAMSRMASASDSTASRSSYTLSCSTSTPRFAKRGFPLECGAVKAKRLGAGAKTGKETTPAKCNRRHKQRHATRPAAGRAGRGSSRRANLGRKPWANPPPARTVGRARRKRNNGRHFSAWPAGGGSPKRQTRSQTGAGRRAKPQAPTAKREGKETPTAKRSSPSRATKPRLQALRL